MSIETAAAQVFFDEASARDLNGSVSEIKEAVVEVLLAPRLVEDLKACMRDSKYGDTWTELGAAINPVVHGHLAHIGGLGDAMIIDVARIGGRSNNYDHLITVAVGQDERELKFELKAGRSIYTYPQILQVYATSGFISSTSADSYPEHLYATRINELAKLAGAPVPASNAYLKKIYGTKYSVHPFFEGLYADKANSIEDRKRIADESIDSYLRYLVEKPEVRLDVPGLQARLLEQCEKVFLFWNRQTRSFAISTLAVDEMTLTGDVSLGYGVGGLANTLLFRNKAGVTIRCLLRWKNNAVILGPGWQIKPEKPPATSS